MKDTQTDLFTRTDMRPEHKLFAIFLVQRAKKGAFVYVGDLAEMLQLNTATVKEYAASLQRRGVVLDHYDGRVMRVSDEWYENGRKKREKLPEAPAPAEHTKTFRSVPEAPSAVPMQIARRDDDELKSAHVLRIEKENEARVAAGLKPRSL